MNLQIYLQLFLIDLFLSHAFFSIRFHLKQASKVPFGLSSFNFYFGGHLESLCFGCMINFLERRFKWDFLVELKVLCRHGY